MVAVVVKKNKNTLTACWRLKFVITASLFGAIVNQFADVVAAIAIVSLLLFQTAIRSSSLKLN